MSSIWSQFTRSWNLGGLIHRRVSACSHRAAWLSVPPLIACAAIAAAQTAAPATAIVDLLRALMATGVEVLYSSELVPPTLEASISLADTDPMSRVVHALAVYHLELRSTGPRRFIVTRSAPVRAPPPAIASATGPTLDEVSVFASRYAFTGETTGEPIDFDARTLEKVPGAQADAVRALRIAPGLATNLSARPYIRGAPVEDVLVEFDGIPLTDPFHFRSFQSLLSVFDPSTVNRAEVFTGGFPVKYGTRSAGVLDLTPRSIESGYEVDVGASRLSYNVESVGHAERWPVEWLITARHSMDPNVLQPIQGEAGEPTFWDSVGRVRWHFEAGSVLTLGWLLQDDHVHLSSHSREEHATGASHDSNGWLGWDWAPSAVWESHSSLSVLGSERRRNGDLNLPAVVNGRLDDEHHLENAALRTAWNYTPSAAFRWTFGAEFVRENAEFNFSKREFSGDVTTDSFGQTVEPRITSDQKPHSATVGMYTAVHRHWQALEAEAGLRFDGQDYRGYGARSQLSPRFNLRYDFTDAWHAYASWGQFTQAQRVDEYRLEENQTTPDSASRAIHMIAGVAHESVGSVHWRLEAYHNHWSSISPYYDNALGAVSLLPELEPDRVRIAPSEATAKGLELSAQRAFGRHFNAWGTYALSRVTDDVNGQEVARSWDQQHAASLGFAWTPARTAASVLLTWHSGWPATPLTVVPGTASAPAYLVVGARNSANWGSYFSADMRLSQTIPLRYGELSLWLDATNVTNRMNDCCIDLNSNHRENTVLVTTNKIWSPRVVNVGFLWRIRRL
jgi:outer membrane receptor protein involved in Fe transport